MSSCCGKQGFSPIERKTTSLKIKLIGQIIDPTIIIIFSYMYSVSVGQEKVVFITYVWIQQEGPAILHVCLDAQQSSKSVIKSTYLPLIINFSKDQVWTWCKRWVGFFALIKFDLSSPRLTTTLNKPWKWSDFYYLTKLSR